MDLTPFELFFHLRTKPQLIFSGINELKDLNQKIHTTLQSFFAASQKIEQDLKLREVKPLVVNQQCLVYQFKCDLCDAGLPLTPARRTNIKASLLQMANISTRNTFWFQRILARISLFVQTNWTASHMKCFLLLMN